VQIQLTKVGACIEQRFAEPACRSACAGSLLFRLHTLISARTAGWWHDLKPPTARRRKLHARFYSGRRTNDAVGLGKLVAEWFGAAASNGGGSPVTSGGHA